MAIKNFVPEKYYSIASKEETAGSTVELQSKLKFNANQFSKAQETCNRYNACEAIVTSVKHKKDTISPGKLYSLSKLQNVLGKKYKMSMVQSLEIVQKLYENGYLTYPRTDTEYLATAEKGKVKKILENCAALGYPVVFKDKKTIFDDSKIESHSAITPTYKIPDKSKLSEAEMQVYSTVFRRFIAVFCSEECLAEKVEITVSVGELEDSFDIETMMETEATHKERFYAMRKALNELGIEALAAGAGCCTICKDCTYPDAPCRFPQQKISSMEALGMLVTEVCKANNLPYFYGENTIAYTSCFLLK